MVASLPSRSPSRRSRTFPPPAKRPYLTRWVSLLLFGCRNAFVSFLFFLFLSPLLTRSVVQARSVLGLSRGPGNYPAAMATPTGLAQSEDRSGYTNLFTLLRGYAHISENLRNALLSTLHDAVLATVRCAESVLASPSDAPASPQGSSSEVSVIRSGLKIATFFLQWCTMQCSAQNKTGKSGAKPKVSSRKRGRKTKNNEDEDDEDDDQHMGIGGSSLSWEAESSQERILATLTQVLELNLPVLWQASAPEEDFTSLIARVSHTMLAHPTMCRSVVVRRALSGVLALLVKKYAYAATVPLIQDVLEHEHLCSTGVGSGDTHVVADIVVSIATEHSCDTILSDILREIGRRDTDGFTTTNAKNVAAFVAATTAAVPQRVLSHVAVLLAHLGSESHIMRNGVIDVVGHILSYVAQPTEDPNHDASREAVTSQTRDSLYDTLAQRFLDSNRFTRSRVCQTWARLFSEKVPWILSFFFFSVICCCCSHTRTSGFRQFPQSERFQSCTTQLDA
jgi:non-SMC mitotic condensation complex subunit 1, N-term